MTLEEKMNYCLVEIAKIDKMSSYHPQEKGTNAGILGEDKVYNILTNYSDNIFKDVVIWNKKHTFATEVDYICSVNGFVLIIEVKEWYGKIKFLNKTEIQISFKNTEGKYCKHIRTNPFYTLDSFYRDFIYYIKTNSNPDNLKGIKKVLVFSRNEFAYENPDLMTYDIKSLSLYQFEKYLKKLQTFEKRPRFNLPKVLPSWDISYSVKKGGYNTLILNDTILIGDKEIPTNEIVHLTFDDDFKKDSLIVTKKNEMIKGFVDRSLIRLIGNINLDRTGIEFILFNQLIHDIPKQSI